MFFEKNSIILKPLCLVCILVEFAVKRGRFHRPEMFESEEILMKKKALVLDDSTPTLRVTSRFLEEEGYSVRTAGNGIEGLQHLKSERFDLIVSDLNMPEMDGLSFAEEARKIALYRNIPFIIVTSKFRSAKENKENRFVNDWVIKPFKKDDLMSAVLKAMA